ncbi:MAG: C1 family peptidase [Desulfococcaceae bacterium]|jgi:hypothetical protein|nr:C1 family peptidase [Desulfococcaceae bacterium]
MKSGILKKTVLCLLLGICLFPGAANAVQDGGYDVFSGLWVKSVLRTSAGSFTLIWKEVGRDITPSGDKVISGYFYADPDDFAYGSQYNPEVFVKIYAAANGWANIAFNHVTVDNVDVYSAHHYSGSAQQSGTVTLTGRLAEHSYTGVSPNADFTPPASTADAVPYQDGGYILFSDLWGKSVLRTSAGSFPLKWKEVGADTTPSGDRVISGYFYADPDDFAYGSQYNPELFVKVYVAANGWANIAFNHVTVDPVDVYSAHSYKGSAHNTGTAALSSRLAEHSYTGVRLADNPAGNHKPVAYAVSLSTNLSIPYIEQQLTATDADSDRLTYELIAPSSGSGYSEAFISPNSGVLYVTLSDDGTPSIVLPYHVSDGKIFSDPGNVTIEIAENSEEKSLGGNEIDPEVYAGFGRAVFMGNLQGAPGSSPTMPSSIDLSGNFPSPGDQGKQGSCSGWATAYALKTYQEKVEMGWSLNTSSHLFSPAFVYNQINGGQDRGALLSEALDIIVRKGCATLASMPYDPNDYRKQPDAQAFQEASDFKAVEKKTLNSTENIKSALVNRQAVVIGIWIYGSFQQLRGADSVYNSKSGGQKGYHFVTITGYDDNRYGGAFRVINSWGQNWGDSGYFWLPYNSQGLLNEAYVLEDAENSITPDPANEPVRPAPTGSWPNLEVKSWSADYSPRPRGAGTLQWEVANTGNATAAAGADVNLMLSKDQNLTSADVYVIYEEIQFDLAPGHSAYRDEENPVSFQFPDTLEEGTYYMAVWADDLNEIRESDENDNISWGSKLISIENSLPDLEVEKWYAEWDDYGYGKLTYRVTNSGKSGADNSDWDINLVLSPDEEIGNDDEIFLFYEDAGYSLASGETVYRDDNSAASFSLYEDAFGYSVPSGTYYMALWVDDLNEVDESNELNNSSLGWKTIDIGGYYRSAESTAGNAYNGRKLPPPDVRMRKVRITDTGDGGRNLEFLDENAVTGPEAGEESAVPPKTVSSKNQVIFPITEAIPMPEPVMIPK